MKIYLSTSAKLYGNVAPVIKELEAMGHEVVPPNGYGEDLDESAIRAGNNYQQWKEKTLRHDIDLVTSCDAILILNYEKNGQKNYVGTSAFLELFKAFELNKKRFLLNPIPDVGFSDEIIGMNPVVLNGDLSAIR